MPPRYAQIALPLPVDQHFTYEVPDALARRAQVGMRAIVPVKKRFETGYIVEITDKADCDGPKRIIDLPDADPVFTADMLKLCRWVADYYCCSWGEALQSALPAAIKKGASLRYRLMESQIHAGRFTDRQKQVIAALYRHGPSTESALAKAVGRAALSNTLQALVRRGVLLAEPAIADASEGMRTETWAVLREDTVPNAETLAQMQRRAPKQAAVYLDLLHSEPARAATELYDKHAANASTLKALEDKRLIHREAREFYRSPELMADARAVAKHALNEEQQAAYREMESALRAHSFQTFLLRGITGSGKTEVYLQAIEHALSLGRNAIILVPEISLTPQTVGRFYARFQQDIAVMHSGLSRGERYDEWRRAQRGEVRIVVGARSAIFAPLPDVGIIVVDEEHDHSYKQGDSPRYHARDAAIMRAKMNDAVCVLGSATPSVEAYQNSAAGKFTRLELLTRATSGALPEVEIIDMRREEKEQAGRTLLSNRMADAVTECLAKGEQAILLLNRRGFAPYVMCPKCGWVAECPDCQVSLTWHHHGAELRCHYCDGRFNRAETCGECEFNPLLYLGAGTQRAEEELAQQFKDARVARMDADTTAGKGGHAKILGRFAKREIDLLIGTQMLAKGHDFPGVTLVGVLNADNGLAVPDFRAAEQSFQLLTQVAGRAGRGDLPGKVYIQTFRPRHYAVQAAAQHDYAGFFAAEIEHRKAAGYPPFRRMLHLLIESEDPQAAERAIVGCNRLLRDAIKENKFKGIEILGPSPAAVRRIKKKYRWQLAVLSRSGTRLNTLARQVRENFKVTGGEKAVQLKIDLDPYGQF